MSSAWVPMSIRGPPPCSALFGNTPQMCIRDRILDCPTRGVDVGVKASMYQLIYEMKKQGKSILMISEEMPELMGMSDRILIMKDGKLNGEFFRRDGYRQHEMIECMI